MNMWDTISETFALIMIHADMQCKVFKVSTTISVLLMSQSDAGIPFDWLVVKSLAVL